MEKIISVLTALVLTVSLVGALPAYADFLPAANADVPENTISLWPVSVSADKIVETTFSIPMIGLYGYITPGCSMSIHLPVDYPGNNCRSSLVSVSVSAGGEEYKLKPVTDPQGFGSTETYENIIRFDENPHSYSGYTDDTVLPLSDGYGGLSSLTVTIRRWVSGDYDLSNDKALFAKDGVFASTAYSEMFDAEGYDITGSKCYFSYLEVTSELFKGANGNEFIAGDWHQGVEWPNSYLSWDHTLAARSEVLKADSAKVVIMLDDPLNGGATYSLYTYVRGNDGMSDEMVYLDDYKLDGITNKLVFDIPADVFGDIITKSNGLTGSALDFAIFENITLFDGRFMSDYKHIDVKKLEESGELFLSNITCNDKDGTAFYYGYPINYASGGVAELPGEGSCMTEAYMELNIPETPQVDLVSLMGTTVENVIDAVKNSFPEYQKVINTVVGYNGSVEIREPGTDTDVMTVDIDGHPGNFCTFIRLSGDNGGLDFLAGDAYPKFCSINGLPVGITQGEIETKFVPGDGEKIFSAPTTTSSLYPGLKLRSYQITKFYPNGDYMVIGYVYANMRTVDGEEVYMSDSEFAASMPSGLTFMYYDVSRLPDLSGVTDISVIGKTPEEAEKLFDSAYPGLSYEVNEFSLIVKAPNCKVSLMSCMLYDGVIYAVYTPMLNPPKTLEGMPSKITSGELEEMLSDKNLPSRTVKSTDAMGQTITYYEFLIDGNAYIYTMDGYNMNYPDSGEAVYYLSVEKRDYIIGDVNADGKVTLDDAILALKRAMNVGLGNETFIEEAADVVTDGRITVDDAIAILKISMNVGA